MYDVIIVRKIKPKYKETWSFLYNNYAFLLKNLLMILCHFLVYEQNKEGIKTKVKLFFISKSTL